MPDRRSGFTLVEVLVVVLIIGIISATVLLSMGTVSDDRALQTEARRMSTLIELASDEATVQGRDFGLELLQTGYRFVEFDPLNRQWGEIFGDDFLRPRNLPEDTEFELYLEDRRVLLDPEPAQTSGDDDDDIDYLPHVLIMSSGDITPFDLEIVRHIDRATVALHVTADGAIKVGDDEDEPL